MSNNYWQPQNDQHGSARSEHQPQKAGLLSNYLRRTPASPAHPEMKRPPAGDPPPLSPLHSQQQKQAPPPLAGPPSQTFSYWQAPTRNELPIMNYPTQRTLSGKIATPDRPDSARPRSFAEIYHETSMDTAPVEKRVPWRRSRALRVTYLHKRRMDRRRHHSSGQYLKKILLFILAALLTIMVTSSAGYAYDFYQRELPQVQNLASMHIPQSTRIYDRSGTLLYTLYANGAWGESGRSTPISYNYLPGVLQDAQTAAEDPTFWTNDGIDPQGMLRALQQYLSAGGHVQSGGSTMTQQLIKNLSNHTEDTLQRKTSEAALAIGLTRQYPKWKIMEMYFNDTPYGAQEKGIEAAVEDYFGLLPQCSADHTHCIPGVAFLDRDLTHCTVTTPKIDEATCRSDKMLALARAVLLAGIPQNPTHFDPSVSQENFQNVLANRVPYVFNQMLQDGMHIDLGLGSNVQDEGPITRDMEPQVKSMISKMHIVGFQQTMLAPHFVNWVIQTLSNELGHGNYNQGYATLENSGLNIYTTLDLNLEQFVEKDVQHNLSDRVYEPYTGYGPLDTIYNVNDSAVVVMNARTGEILAMDGSANYNNHTPAVSGQVNAALAYRQPGSSIKPIIYATALEEGWYPGIKLLDNKTYFPDGGNQAAPVEGNTYAPTDYMRSYHPDLPTDIRISLQNSFNIPAIKTLMFAGVDNVANMARRLGITALDEDVARYNAQHPNAPNTLEQLFGPSMALGTPGIPLVQMVGAYQVFANNGARVPQHNILGIWDNYGRNLYRYDPTHPNSTQVLSPQITFLLNNMLSDNTARRYEFQGINTLTLSDLPGDPSVAAKTGTTDAFLDNWTIGYTPSIVVGVWSGNANGDNPMHSVIGISGAGPIWQDVIEYASGNCKLGMCPQTKYPTTPFPQPPGIVQATVNPINGLQGNGVVDWMINGEQPQQSGLICKPSPTDGANNSDQNSDPQVTSTPTPTPDENADVCSDSSQGNSSSSQSNGDSNGGSSTSNNSGGYSGGTGNNAGGYPGSTGGSGNNTGGYPGNTGGTGNNGNSSGDGNGGDNGSGNSGGNGSAFPWGF